jgi:plastocyanin
VKQSNISVIVLLAASVAIFANYSEYAYASCVTAPSGAYPCEGQNSTPSNMIPTKSHGPVQAVKANANVIITLGCGPKDIHNGSYLNTCYQPTVLVVKPGTTVTWRNDDTAVHSVTDGNVWVYYSISYFFESATLNPGETFSYQYNHSGAYPYFDTFNPWETGLVIVEK